MTTVSAADMLGNDVIREELLQKLRENAARLQQEGTTLPPQASQDLISISEEARRRLEEQKAAADLPQTTEQTEQPRRPPKNRRSCREKAPLASVWTSAPQRPQKAKAPPRHIRQSSTAKTAAASP